MEPLYWTPLLDPSMRPLYETPLWDPSLRPVIFYVVEIPNRLSHTNIKDWVHDRRLSHKHQGLGP